MKTLFLIFSLLLSPFSLAGSCPTERPDIRVYYGNGMLTSSSDAVASRNTLQALSYSQLQGYRPQYYISYNHNENPLEQILEVARQKIVQDYGVILLWLAGIEEAPDWFKEILNEMPILRAVFTTRPFGGNILHEG